MSIFEDLFEGDEFDEHQIIADELARQTLNVMPALVKLRDKKGLSQEYVAERMGITRAGVAQLERKDSNPTLSTLRRYALAIDALLTIEVCDGRPWATHRVHVTKEPDAFEKAARKWHESQAAAFRVPGRYRPHGARVHARRAQSPVGMNAKVDA